MQLGATKRLLLRTEARQSNNTSNVMCGVKSEAACKDLSAYEECCRILLDNGAAISDAVAIDAQAAMGGEGAQQSGAHDAGGGADAHISSG